MTPSRVPGPLAAVQLPDCSASQAAQWGHQEPECSSALAIHSAKISATVFWFVQYWYENTAFFDGNKLEQDPFYTIDGSVEYRFESGIWASASAGVGIGGRFTVNGIEKDDHKENYGWAVSIGFPVMRSVGFKATYLETDHWSEVGTASQTVSVGLVGTW